MKKYKKFAIVPLPFGTSDTSNIVYALCKYKSLTSILDNSYRRFRGVRLLRVIGNSRKFYRFANYTWDEDFIPRRDKKWFDIRSEEDSDPIDEPILFKADSEKEFLEAAEVYMAIEGEEIQYE